MTQVLGVIVLARNGDRLEYYQDPTNYDTSYTETTPLGEVQSHNLGSLLRSVYLDPRSPSYIKDIHPDLVNNREVQVRVKGGGEGPVVFDSAIALLQGLFPPTPKNRIVLANDSVIVAPLGGYQYVPVETVEPNLDRSLESWTDCPAFEKHVREFYASDGFKDKSKEAEPFFTSIRDFVFGRPATLRNIWNIYDYVHSELTHNKTYAYRLPPTFVEQARALANYHEDRIFSDNDMRGIGNIAGRTILYTIISALARIAYNGDPLKFLLVESTYQPFISLFHQVGVTKYGVQLKGIPNYAGALAIELRRGSPPDTRDFLRFKFKNGTKEDFEPVHVFGHRSDIPLTEFIYRTEGAAITSNAQWAQVCGVKSASVGVFGLREVDGSFASVVLLIILLGMHIVFKHVRRSRRAKQQERARAEFDEDCEGVNTREKSKYLLSKGLF